MSPYLSRWRALPGTCAVFSKFHFEISDYKGLYRNVCQSFLICFQNFLLTYDANGTYLTLTLGYKKKNTQKNGKSSSGVNTFPRYWKSCVCIKQACSSFISFFFFFFTASNGIQCAESLEYLYAPLALILHSLSLIGYAKVSEAERHQPIDIQASVSDIFYTQLVNQSGVLGLLWLLHPDNPWEVLRVSSWRNLLFQGYLLAIVLLGMVLNFLVCFSALCISPLAAAMLYSTRCMVQPFLHLL